MSTGKIMLLLVILAGVYLLAAEWTGENKILSRAAVALLPEA
jgi:hypothetical protein